MRLPYDGLGISTSGKAVCPIFLLPTRQIICPPLMLFSDTFISGKYIPEREMTLPMAGSIKVEVLVKSEMYQRYSVLMYV